MLNMNIHSYNQFLIRSVYKRLKFFGIRENSLDSWFKFGVAFFHIWKLYDDEIVSIYKLFL